MPFSCRLARTLVKTSLSSRRIRVTWHEHSSRIVWLTILPCTLVSTPPSFNADVNEWRNEWTQIEYESKLNLRFDGGYGFTAFSVDISTLNEITNQSIPHEGRQMCGLRVESDICCLSWVSPLFKIELVPIVKSIEIVGVYVIACQTETWTQNLVVMTAGIFFCIHLLKNALACRVTQFDQGLFEKTLLPRYFMAENLYMNEWMNR